MRAEVEVVGDSERRFDFGSERIERSLATRLAASTLKLS